MHEVVLTRAAEREPRLDFGWANIQIRECRQIDPLKIDVSFSRPNHRQAPAPHGSNTPRAPPAIYCRRLIGSRSGIIAVQLFHVEQLGFEDQCEFVVIGLAVVECGFGGQQQGPDGDLEIGLLVELADQGLGGGFGELDVPPGEIQVVSRHASAHQHMRMV